SGPKSAGPFRGQVSSQAPPDIAEVAADLVFSLNRSAIWACCRGEPAVMIGRRLAPAAPKSGPRCDRLCHPKWLVRTLPAELRSGHPRRYAAPKISSSVKVQQPRVATLRPGL